MEGWGEFLEDMKEYYNVDLSVLTDDFASEQRDYYLATSAWGDVHPSQLVGVAAPFHTYDLHKARSSRSPARPPARRTRAGAGRRPLRSRCDTDLPRRFPSLPALLPLFAPP
jgi:hypothetical protein